MSPTANRTCLGSILLGAIAFTMVSLAGFSIWAFAGRWFYQNVGEAGLYAVTTVVFIGLAGLLMHPLLGGPNRLGRFYAAFVPAFIAYAFVWSVAWFSLGLGDGEWIGSLLGCAAFAFVLGKMLKSTAGILGVILALFLAHSAGYFAGGLLYGALRNPPEIVNGLTRRQVSLLARMQWGFFYGLGFGAGIGFAFYRFQRGSPAGITTTSESDKLTGRGVE